MNFYRQSGGSLAHFEGVRFQRGRGWFSKLNGRLMPALKYLGRNALSAATSFLGDIAAGRDVKTALKRTALDTSSKVAGDISEKVKRMATKSQSGSGAIRRKRRKQSRKVKPIIYKGDQKPIKVKKQRKTKRKIVKKTKKRK